MKKIMSFITSIAIASQALTLPIFAMENGDKNTNNMPK